MDNMFFEDAISTITDGLIEEVTSDNDTTLVTVAYADCMDCDRNQTIRLAIGNNTYILDEFGNRINASDLEKDMIINATYDSAMTRSIPPQSNAILIRVVSRPMPGQPPMPGRPPMPDNTIVGRIIDINREYRQLTTISNGRLSSIVRFNVPINARIIDMFGRPISFSNLIPGLRVQIRHAPFMTSSIPPQTTAFEIRIIR